MSGPPRLPPGISLQRAAPDPPQQPNLPPGISIKRTSDDSSQDKLRNLPSSIQVQRSSSQNNSDEGMNKLASLGIQISRSESPSSNSAMDKLSGLGISVSGGPSPAPSPVQNRYPQLPPGVSLSGGPSSMGRQSPDSNLQQRLPPGISIQGMSNNSQPSPMRSPVPMPQTNRVSQELTLPRPSLTQATPHSYQSQHHPRPPPMQFPPRPSFVQASQRQPLEQASQRPSIVQASQRPPIVQASQKPPLMQPQTRPPAPMQPQTRPPAPMQPQTRPPPPMQPQTRPPPPMQAPSEPTSVLAQPRLRQPQDALQHPAQAGNVQRPLQQASPGVYQGQAVQPRPLLAEASPRPCSPPSQVSSRNSMMQGRPQGTNNTQPSSQDPIRTSNINEPSTQRPIVNQNVQIKSNTQIMQPRQNNRVEIRYDSGNLDQQGIQLPSSVDARPQSINQFQHPTQIQDHNAVVTNEKNVERLSPPLSNQHIQNKPELTIPTDLQQQQLKSSIQIKNNNLVTQAVNSDIAVDNSTNIETMVTSDKADQDQADSNKEIINNTSKSDDINEELTNSPDVNKYLSESNINQREESSNAPDDEMDTVENLGVSISALDAEKDMYKDSNNEDKSTNGGSKEDRIASEEDQVSLAAEGESNSTKGDAEAAEGEAAAVDNKAEGEAATGGNIAEAETAAGANEAEGEDAAGDNEADGEGGEAEGAAAEGEYEDYEEVGEEWEDYEEDYYGYEGEGYDGEGYEGEGYEGEGYEETEEETQGEELNEDTTEGDAGLQNQGSKDNGAEKSPAENVKGSFSSISQAGESTSHKEAATGDANKTLEGSNNTPASNVSQGPVKAALSITSDPGSQGQLMSTDGDNSSQDSNYEIMNAMANDSTNDQQDENSMDTTEHEPEPEPMKRPQPRTVNQINEDSQGSNTSHFNLPPGISISSNNDVSNCSTDVSMPASSPVLPPGISISPFKKPSTRPSVDDDACSTTSQDRASDVSNRSISMDKTPRVGADTNCVICMMRCTSDRKPRLLCCLHSACQECFQSKLAESRREESGADEVFIDGDSAPFVPEVTCPICKSSTSESELIPNYFADDSEQDDTSEDDIQICGGCDENQIAASYCSDCEDYLCAACVRAHQKVKITKNHQITQVKTRHTGAQNYKICQIHPNESLSLYCESCDQLNCRDCQLSEKHRNCKYSYSYEVAPQIKGNISQSASDIRMKKSHIEESVGILSTKISEVNIKERSLLTQLKDVKDFIVSKVEDRYRELTAEVTKRTRDKRKTLENRKNNLDRSLWQMEHALAFTEHLVNGSVEDTKLMLSKKVVTRQLRRLKRVNQAVNMSGPDMEFKLDLYFQHFHGPNLHSNIDSVLKMICSDIKVSALPILAPRPKSPPPAAPKLAPPPPQPVVQPVVINSPVQKMMNSPRQQPMTPTRVMPATSNMNMRGSSAVRGSHVRQLATPTKSPMRITPAGRGMSPARSMIGTTSPMRGVGGGRGMMSTRGGAAMVGRGGMNAGMRGVAPARRGRGRGSSSVVVGGQIIKSQPMGMVARNVGQMPVRGMKTRVGGAMIQQRVGRGGAMMNTGRGGQIRGGGQMAGGRLPAPVIQQSRRGRAASNQVPNRTIGGNSQYGSVNQQYTNQKMQYSNQNQQYTNAALGYQAPQPRSPQAKPRPRMQRGGANSIRMNSMNSSMSSQQNFNQSPGMMQSRPRQPAPPNMNMSSNMNSSVSSLSSSASSLSSWHTPSQAADRPVSPPRAKENNFKILLPKMGGGSNTSITNLGSNVVDIMGNSIIQPISTPSTQPLNNTPLPSMSSIPCLPAASRPPPVKKEAAPEIIAIDIDDDDDEPEMKKVPVSMLNSRGSVISNSSSNFSSSGGHGVDPLAITRTPHHPSSDSTISKTEYTPLIPDPLATDPLALNNINLTSSTSLGNSTSSSPITLLPPSSSLSTTVISSSSLSMHKVGSKPSNNGPSQTGSIPMVSINGGSLDMKPDSVKLERQHQQGGRVEPIKIKLPNPLANNTKKTSSSISPGRSTGRLDVGDWCAVCHDGGDTLYCCDRCPKVYHMYCYIPVMDSEPADDWVCLMCEDKDGIFKLSNKMKKGCNLTEQDVSLCRRLLLEMYNLWPESIPFRDCADLNFDAYLAKINDPIALDVIRDKLGEDSPNQYSSIKMFLVDLRKMFRNAFIFNTKDSEIYKHAQRMEEKLDKLLAYWAPEFANDALIDVTPTPRPGSSGAGAGGKRKGGPGSMAGGSGAKRGRKMKQRNISGNSDIIEDGGSLSEGEREEHEYNLALQKSLQDQDPNDTDFEPSAPKRGRGRGRPRGRKS